MKKDELIAPGHRACAGCGEVLGVKFLLQALGKNTVVCCATGCMEITTTPYPETSWKVPWLHVAFENAAAAASGVKAALIKLGRPDVNVVALGGDGGMVDIGFQAISGAMERGHDLLIVCTDNEAYMNCLSLSANIMTEKGLKKVADVKVGDRVYAFDQRSHKLVLKKCTGVFDNGSHEIFELGTLHRSIKATSNHPFLAVKRNGRGQKGGLMWKTLAEIRPGDEVVVLKELEGGRPYVFGPLRLAKVGDPKVTHVNDVQLPSRSTPELMEFLGFYVGDGWARPTKGEVGFALPEGTEERERLLELGSGVFKLDASRVDDNYVYMTSVNLARFIESLGFGKGARNKTVPDWVFMLPKAEREAFVLGLMQSDGYAIGKSSRYVSSSFELLERLRLLLQTMGYRVGKIHKQRKKKGDWCVYRKLLRDSEYGYVCFSKKRGLNAEYPSQYRQLNFLLGNEHFETERVRYVKAIKVEPTLDLRVEGEHNFIANGFVVHNTGIQRSGATPLFAATTTSPAGRVVPGKRQWKKNMPMICAAHGIPYVATASSSYPQDLIDKVKKALTFQGPKYIHIHTPCPIGWGYESAETINIGKLAVETGMWALYEIVEGKLRITQKPGKLRPLKDYLGMQKRFKHLTDEQISKMQALVTKQYEELLAKEGNP